MTVQSKGKLHSQIFSGTAIEAFIRHRTVTIKLFALPVLPVEYEGKAQYLCRGADKSSLLDIKAQMPVHLWCRAGRD